MEKITKSDFKIHAEKHQGSKIILLPLVLLVGILAISMVSAGMLDVTRTNAALKSRFDISPSANIYPAISIRTDLNIPFLSSTLADLVLLDHTAICGADCYSVIDINLANDGALVDDVRFNTVDGDNEYPQPIRSYQFYIKTDEISQEVNDYEYQCTPTGQIITNLSGSFPQETCSNVIVGTHTETDPVWTPYNVGDVVPAGDYEIKLTGEKRPDRIVDWQIETAGSWTTDWALWSGSNLFDPFTGSNGDAPNSTLWLRYNLPTIQNNKINFSLTNAYLVSQNTYAFTNGVDLEIYGTWQNGDKRTGIQIGDLKNNTSASPLTLPDFDGYDMWRYDNGLGICYIVNGAETCPVNNVPTFSGGNIVNWKINMSGGNINFYYDRGLGWTLGYSEAWRHANTSMYFYVGFSGTGTAHSWSYDNATINLGLSSVTLNSPVNNYASTGGSMTFNCSANIVGGATLANMSLWDNASGSWSLLNPSVTTTSPLIFSNSHSDGTYIWNCQACDSDGDCGFSTTNNTFIIDSVSPTIVINSGNGTQNYGTLTQNQTINYTISDSNLNTSRCSITVSCNVLLYPSECYTGSIPCTSGMMNSTSVPLPAHNDGTFSALISAYDNAGNLAQSTLHWSYNVLQNNLSYVNSTTSGAINNFSFDFTYPASYNGLTVLLNYNNTNYTMSSSDTGNTRNYSVGVIAPTVTSQTNVTFNYMVGLTNLTGTTWVSSPSYNQTVSSFLIDNCATNSNVLLSMTMVDEESLVGINGTINALVNIYSPGTNNLIAVYNKSFNYVTPTPARVCINSTGTYRMDYTINYYGNSTIYFQKYLNIQNQIINPTNYLQNLTLYDLLIADGYTFRITLIGATNSNLVVSVYKQYLPSNNYLLVESPLTSSNDEAIAHLVPSNAIYNFVVSYMGTVLGIFNQYTVTCQNPSIGQCQVILNLQSEVGDIPSYQNYLNVSISNQLNQTSNVLSTSFVTTDGIVHTITQLVLQNDGYGNTTICNYDLAATSGVINCNIPTAYQNTSYILQTFVDGQLRGSELFTEGQNPNFYGVDILIEILIFTCMVLMMTSHPVLIVIGAMLGMIFAIALIFMASASFASMIVAAGYFIAAGIIIVWQISRRVG